MWSIILKTISLKKIAIASYSFAAIVFAWIYVALFPALSERAEEIEELFAAYPEDFLQAFNIESLSVSTLESFVAAEHLSIVWPFLVIFLGVSFAGSYITKEIEQGTIEILLSRSVSRVKLFVGKYIGAVIGLLIFSAVSFYIFPILAELFDVEYVLQRYTITTAMGFLFGLTFLSLGFMLAAFFSERNRTYMFASGIVLLMYIAKIVPSFNEDLENFQYISYFHYLDPEKILLNGEIDPVAVAVFLISSLIFLVVGTIYFDRRDLAV